jgi:hypothetical protein
LPKAGFAFTALETARRDSIRPQRPRLPAAKGDQAVSIANGAFEAPALPASVVQPVRCGALVPSCLH